MAMTFVTMPTALGAVAPRRRHVLPRGTRAVRCASANSAEMPPRRQASRVSASARDVSASAAGEGKPDLARVAAAVRLAAAVSPALADARRGARVVPRGVNGAGLGASGLNAGRIWGSTERPIGAGPSYGRYAEVLGVSSRSGAAGYPGGWWGEGTYTDAHLRGDAAAMRAVGRGLGSGFGFEPKRVRRDGDALSAFATDGPASSDDDDESSVDTETRRANPFEQLWLRLVKPLRDFGFGRTNIWEGGVGLFLIGGAGIAALTIQWILGVNFNKMRSYQAFVEFPFACGIQVGTQVRVRGVKVGNVLSVRPNLERVEVLVEMDDDGIVIPRNSLVEANQSGLIAETIIDITPEIPIPKAQWGPLDSGCEGEGLVVCDRGKIVGVPGVSMDELVGIATKLAREMDAQNGIAKMFATAETAQDLMKNLEPLLLEAAEIAKELRPMLQNVQEQGTLDTIELLAGHATKAVTDIRELKRTILTDENQEMLRQSITIMTKTLQHMEKVSGDISSVSGDPATRQNLRHLIQCLSRLVDK